MKRRPPVSLVIFLLGTMLLSACGSEPSPTPPGTTAAVITTVASSTTSAATTSATTPSVTATSAAATTAPALTTALSGTTPPSTTTSQGSYLNLKYSTPVLNNNHSGSIYSLAFSPDDKTLATGSTDKTVKLWDLATKNLLYTFKDAGLTIRSMAFSADGKELAVSGFGTTVIIWDVATGKTLQKLDDPKASTNNAVTFSPAGKMLAAANDDKTIKIWDTVTGKLTTQLKGTNNQIGVAFSSDGKLAAGSDKAGQINVWDLSQADKPLATFKSKYLANFLKFSSDSKTLFGGDSLWDISGAKAQTTFANGIWGVSSDGTKVAVYNDKTKGFEIVDASSNQVISRFTGGTSKPNPNGIAFNKAFDTFATTNYASAADIYDITTDKLAYKIGGSQAWQSPVVISPDSTLIAHFVLNNSQLQIELLNAADGKILNKISAAEYGIPEQFGFSPDSKSLAAVGHIWDTKTGAKLADFQADKATYSEGKFEIFSPDGKMVAVAGTDGPVFLWDNQGKLVNTIKPTVDDVESLAFSPDSKNLAVVTKNGVEVYDLAANPPALLRSYRLGLIHTAAFSADQKTLLIGGFDTGVYQFERTNPGNYQDFKGINEVHRVAYSVDGKRVFGVGEGYVFIWDTKSHQELARTDITNTYNTGDFAVSADDKLLVTSQADGTIKLWLVAPAGAAATSTVAATPSGTVTAAATPTPIPAVNASLLLKASTPSAAGHTQMIHLQRFSPDGKILASASQDSSIRLWDIASQKLLTTLKGSFDLLRNIKFSADSKTLAVYSGDDSGTGGQAQLWDVATGNLNKTVQLTEPEQLTAAFSANLKFVATGARDNTVVYDLTTGQKIATFAFSYGVSDLAFSPDAKTLYVAGGNNETQQRLALFNVQTGETTNIALLVAGTLTHLAVSPNQKIVAASTRAGPVIMIDGLTGQQLGSYTQPDKLTPTAVGFDSNNNLRAVYQDKNQTNQVYDVSIGTAKLTGQVSYKNAAKNFLSQATLGDNNAKLAFGDTEGDLTVADIATGNTLANFAGSPGAYPSASAFNPTNQTWVVLNRTGIIQVWDMGLTNIITTLGQSQPITTSDSLLTLSPNGNLVATGGQFSGAITLWDLKAAKKITTLPDSRAATLLQFSSDSTHLMAVVNYTALYSWDMGDNSASSHVLASLTGVKTYSSYSKLSSDGSLVGFITKDNAINILDLKSNKTRTLPGKFSNFMFLPGTMNLLVILSNGGVEVVDSSGQVVTTLDKSNSTLLSAVFSPDGKIAAGSDKGAIVLWDTATWDRIFTTGSIQPAPQTLSFSGDGKNLFSGQADGSLKLWDLK